MEVSLWELQTYLRFTSFASYLVKLFPHSKFVREYRQEGGDSGYYKV